ncbi:putative NAD kinase 2, mitochondrial [Apostichopus japonicus]|uniref:Putative NAD kinase 2, mitochondrial n=1 Tax=Stichopus japonicus TaxID=307972 RepID=A0A2G8LDD1_STIJA|nr:putative NAD kinase 2, mitochondrial [Apostichopus japonicus]
MTSAPLPTTQRDGCVGESCTNMKDFTEEAVDWAELVISAGGDGTFLSASRKVRNELGSASLLRGGDTSHPIDLYDEDLTFSDHRHLHNSERQKSLERRLNGEDSEEHIIPIRALNEVFVGESLSSRMSYYEISIDNGPLEKQKSSGITICTGTGSTSWSFNINKLSYQSVEEVLKIANRQTGSNYSTNQESVKTVADSFNGRLLFDPRVLQMVYSVRDPVVYGIFQVRKPRGFARKITIRSRCRDACLTVDAGTSYLFNDGALATLEMFDEDAIKTIEMVE